MGLAGYELLAGGMASIPLSTEVCPLPDVVLAGVAHPLFLARNKGLEAWGHAEPQLVDVGRLILAVDLYSDACLK